jgi:tetratricopeptide (TPR) repeat protein
MALIVDDKSIVKLKTRNTFLTKTCEQFKLKGLNAAAAEERARAMELRLYRGSSGSESYKQAALTIFKMLKPGTLSLLGAEVVLSPGSPFIAAAVKAAASSSAPPEPGSASPPIPAAIVPAAVASQPQPQLGQVPASPALLPTPPPPGADARTAPPVVAMKPLGHVLHLLLRGTLCGGSPLRLLRGTDTQVLRAIYCLVREGWRDAISTDYAAIPGYTSLGQLPAKLSGGAVWPTPDWDDPASLIQVNMMPIIMCPYTGKQSLPERLHKYWPLLMAVFQMHMVMKGERGGRVKFGDEGRMGYLTLHETEVKVGCSQRRAGLHTESPGICRDPGSLHAGNVLGWGCGSRWHGPSTLKGGIYMASTVGKSTGVWNCSVVDPEAIGPGGDVEHLRYWIEKKHEKGTREVVRTPGAGELVWMHDRVPHASLPLGEEDDNPHEIVTGADGQPVVRRQFFRLVAGEVSVWYDAHSSRNPVEGMQAQAEIIYGDKFAPPLKQAEVEAGQSGGARKNIGCGLSVLGPCHGLPSGGPMFADAADAERVCRLRLARDEALHGAASGEAARCMRNLGIVLTSRSYEEALEQCERALAIYEAAEDEGGVAMLCADMGKVYQSWGQYPQALAAYGRVVTLRAACTGDPILANILKHMGAIYESRAHSQWPRHTGDGVKALEHYEKALAIWAQNAILGDIVDAVSIHYDPKMKVTVVEEDQEFIDDYYALEDDEENDLQDRLHPWLLRLELNLKALRERHLWDAGQIVPCLIDAPENGGLGLDEFFECIATLPNSPNQVVRIRPRRVDKSIDMSEEDDADMRAYLTKIADLLLQKLELGGIPGFQACFMDRDCFGKVHALKGWLRTNCTSQASRVTSQTLVEPLLADAGGATSAKRARITESAIKGILNRRRNGPDYEYKVRWTRMDQPDSWVPTAHVPEAHARRFKRRRTQRHERRRAQHNERK